MFEPHTTALYAELLQIQKKHNDAAQDNLDRIKRPRKIQIPVTDQSESEEAEIAWGTNLKTGNWCASIMFGPEVVSETYGEEDADTAWKEREEE